MRSKSVFQTFVLVFFSSSLAAQTIREVISTPKARHAISYANNIAQVVKELRHYKAGNKVGKWVWYNEDGSVQEETAYQL